MLNPVLAKILYDLIFIKTATCWSRSILSRSWCSSINFCPQVFKREVRSRRDHHQHEVYSHRFGLSGGPERCSEPCRDAVARSPRSMNPPNPFLSLSPWHSNEMSQTGPKQIERCGKLVTAVLERGKYPLKPVQCPCPCKQGSVR